MEPITHDEIFMAAAAGEYEGELPEPVIRPDFYWLKIKERIEEGASVAPEDIDAAIEAYLNSHDADIVTEQELSDALAGYYDKTDIDTALGGKAAADHNHSGVYAPVSHTHAQADIAGLDTALAGKVDKETGKSLMTADEHTKLTGIESGAQVNTVTGVKGNAENDYRTGEINISPANIGLGNVDNTSDADKPISTATQTALGGKQNALTAGDNITIATVNGVLTISADTPAPTDVQVQTAVDNYIDQNGVVFNTSAEITEVLNGN